MNVLVFTVWPVAFWQVPDSQVERLRADFPDIDFTHARTDEEVLSAMERADIALASRLTAAMVRRAARLQWVHSTAAAVGILPLEELRQRGIPVTNSRGIQSVPMAEYVLGGLLQLSRRFDLILAAQSERRWIQDRLSSDSWPWVLHGRKMTVIGLGSIGREVARRAAAFGIPVTGVRRRTMEPTPPFVQRVLGSQALDEALHGCDILVLAAPLVPQTDRMIDARRIGLLNRGAILVNVARGKLVDEQAMIAALQSGHLGGAVLDVFEREPLDPASPLWKLPNVLVSPHCSGLRPDHWQDAITLFAENLKRFQRGKPLLNLVDCAAGY